MRALCFDPQEAWEVLPADLRTERAQSLVFGMNARSVVGISVSVDWMYKDYPWKLFLLIDTESDNDEVVDMILVHDCRKLWCHFTIHFMSRFPTKVALRGDLCRAVLLMIAIFFRVHMARIENRHALLRRMVTERGSTWLCELISVCSDLMLHWARKWEKEGWEGKLRSTQKVAGGLGAGSSVIEPSTATTPECRKSGGAQRAFNSFWLRNNKRQVGETRKEHFTRLSAALTEAFSNPDTRSHYEQLGADATLTGQSGGIPFGPTRKQPVATPAAPGITESVSAHLAMVAFSGSSGLDAQFRATRQQRAEAARKTKDSENNADATLVAWAKLQMGSSTASHSGSYSLTADMFSNWCVPQPGSGGVLVFHFLPPLASLGRIFVRKRSERVDRIYIFIVCEIAEKVYTC
jgi:hypothetical protein